jgi:hypothetical protein
MICLMYLVVVSFVLRMTHLTYSLIISRYVLTYSSNFQLYVCLKTLGNAPKWCTFLDNITEELEEKPADTGLICYFIN